jgi:hypothetical protein
MMSDSYIDRTPPESSLVAQLEILEDDLPKCEITIEPEVVVEMKQLPSHLKYQFLDVEK